MAKASETLRKRYEEATREYAAYSEPLETRLKSKGNPLSDDERGELQRLSDLRSMRKDDHETQLRLEQSADGAIVNGEAVRTPEGSVVTPSLGDVSALEAIGQAVKYRIQQQPMPGNITELWGTFGFNSVLSEMGNVVIPPGLISAARSERAVRAQTRAATGTAHIANRAYLESVSGFVRAMPVAHTLGVVPMGVPAGKVRFGWVDNSPNAAARDEDPDLAVVTPQRMTVEQQELAPVRILSPRGMTYEAAATYGMLGELLLADSVDAVRDHVESLVINGDGTAPNFSGLFPRAHEARATPSAVDTYKSVISVFESLIDGKYAADMSDLRAVMHPLTFGWLSSLTPAASGELTATRYLTTEMDSLKVSAHAAPRSSSNKVHTVLVRRGMLEGSHAFPNWGTEIGIDMSSSLGIGVKLSVWDLCAFFVPVQADHARQDFVKVMLRQTA